MSIFSMNRGGGNAPKGGGTVRSTSQVHILNAISNEGDPSLLIWKSPVMDFNTNSVLIVNPGEAAVFIKNGQIVQEFENGRYELKTENYPFLSNLRNLLSGGQSVYTSEIYFVRKALSNEILWGTDSPIQLRDPVQRLQTSLRGRGSYKVTVDNAGSSLQLQLHLRIPMKKFSVYVHVLMNLQRNLPHLSPRCLANTV